MGLIAVLVLATLAAVGAQTAGWGARLVSVLDDEPQYVSGDVWPGRPPGHRWVTLVVALASPAKDASLPAAQIRLVDDQGAYPATAIGHQVNAKDAPVFLPLLTQNPPHSDPGMGKSQGRRPRSTGWSSIRKFVDGRFDPVGVHFFQDMNPKKGLFGVDLEGPSGGREVRLFKSPLNLVLLFAVPGNAVDLRLHVGDGDPIPLPMGR
ncbi:MAG TPA: hypothetical protein VMR52_00005 [Dehalococcoidia bacterium]|nr:hypothetical protein [Dehalococcoidia bacterium]